MHNFASAQLQVIYFDLGQIKYLDKTRERKSLFYTGRENRPNLITSILFPSCLLIQMNQSFLQVFHTENEVVMCEAYSHDTQRLSLTWLQIFITAK